MNSLACRVITIKLRRPISLIYRAVVSLTVIRVTRKSTEILGNVFGSFCIRSGKSSIQILAGALILGPITMGMIILAVCEIKYQSIKELSMISAQR